MPDSPRVRQLVRQQAAIAGFSSFALRHNDLLTVLSEAARVCAEALDVRSCKVWRYRREENDLFVVAGHGWKPGVVDRVVARADTSSPQGRAFVTGAPTICSDLRTDRAYTLPAFYGEHGIISTIDVVINGGDRPYGVLELDNDEQHDYDENDINFLTGFASVLAEAVATSARTELLRTTINHMKGLVADKDRLLDQKRVLAEELQHRVRNNLQLVYGMLGRQLDDTADEAGQLSLRAIARRVSCLAQVYDQLLGSEMTRTTDFGGYVQSLCVGLAEIQRGPGSAITLACETEPINIDLDVVTAMEIVIAELVTNGYDHAYPGGTGSINVSMRRAAGDTDTATVTIADGGTGFAAKADTKRHGLGLVRRLVEQVRGTVVVDSRKGTQWTIRFPAPMAIADSNPAG